MAVALWFLAPAVWGCAAQPGDTFGSVRLALEASSCQEHCVVSVQAQPFRSRDDALGIGPPSEPTACGEPLVLRDLPVGLRVTVKAWASDGLDNRFVGWSDPVTVAADQAVAATVRLEPTSPPVLSTLSPEPVVLPAGGGTVAVRAEGEGFAGGAGLAAVEAGGAALPAEGWTDAAVTFTVSAPVPTAQVRVVACGAASTPAPLRVLPETPGARAVDLGGACDGAQVVTLDALPDGRAAAALSCAGGAPGALLPVTLTPGACALGVSAWPLDVAPTALALDEGGGAWVAQGDALARYDLALGTVGGAQGGPGAATVTWPTSGSSAPPEITRVALWDGWIFALARAEDGSTTLAGGALAPPEGAAAAPEDPIALQPIPGVGAGLRLVDVAASADELLLVAAPAQGAGLGATGRLAHLRDPAAGFPEEWPLPDCPAPVAVATSPSGALDTGWAAVACAGETPGLVVVPQGGAPADAHHVDLGLAAGRLPTAVRLDVAGSVAFVAAASSDAASVTAVDLRAGATLRTWTLWDDASASRSPSPFAASGFASFGGLDRLALPGPAPATVTVLAPYDDGDPCAAPQERP